MTALSPIIILSEEKKEDAIIVFRKEQDEGAWGKPFKEIKCPNGKRRVNSWVVKGVYKTTYKFAVCDCPKTAELIGWWPYLCTFGAPCPPRKALFPNGTFA